MNDTLEGTDLDLILLDDFDEELPCASDNCENAAEYSMRHVQCGQGYLFCKTCARKERAIVEMHINTFGYEVTCRICNGVVHNIADLEVTPLG